MRTAVGLVPDDMNGAVADEFVRAAAGVVVEYRCERSAYGIALGRSKFHDLHFAETFVGLACNKRLIDRSRYDVPRDGTDQSTAILDARRPGRR